ncbi:hypothetical protein OG747_46505 [Streptomyces sp. NBC_01384]|uniref:hypothetical protein n=1 Tax=Streptomyces sp. NBC_01384 TaxID=2903847 RepID=UPI00324BE219
MATRSSAPLSRPAVPAGGGARGALGAGGGTYLLAQRQRAALARQLPGPPGDRPRPGSLAAQPQRGAQVGQGAGEFEAVPVVAQFVDRAAQQLDAAPGLRGGRAQPERHPAHPRPAHRRTGELVREQGLCLGRAPEMQQRLGGAGAPGQQSGLVHSPAAGDAARFQELLQGLPGAGGGQVVAAARAEEGEGVHGGVRLAGQGGMQIQGGLGVLALFGECLDQQGERGEEIRAAAAGEVAERGGRLPPGAREVAEVQQGLGVCRGEGGLPAGGFPGRGLLAQTAAPGDGAVRPVLDQGAQGAVDQLEGGLGQRRAGQQPFGGRYAVRGVGGQPQRGGADGRRGRDPGGRELGGRDLGGRELGGRDLGGRVLVAQRGVGGRRAGALGGPAEGLVGLLDAALGRQQPGQPPRVGGRQFPRAQGGLGFVEETVGRGRVQPPGVGGELEGDPQPCGDVAAAGTGQAQTGLGLVGVAAGERFLPGGVPQGLDLPVVCGGLGGEQPACHDGRFGQGVVQDAGGVAVQRPALCGRERCEHGGLGRGVEQPGTGGESRGVECVVGPGGGVGAQPGERGGAAQVGLLAEDGQGQGEPAGGRAAALHTDRERLGEGAAQPGLRPPGPAAVGGARLGQQGAQQQRVAAAEAMELRGGARRHRGAPEAGQFRGAAGIQAGEGDTHEAVVAQQFGMQA